MWASSAFRSFDRREKSFASSRASRSMSTSDLRDVPSKTPDQFHRHRRPGRIVEDLLLAAGAERQDLDARSFAPDQPAEDIAAGRAGNEDIAIERAGETLG